MAAVLKADKGKGNSWGVGIGGEGEVEQGEALVSFLQAASLLDRAIPEGVAASSRAED